MTEPLHVQLQDVINSIEQGFEGDVILAPLRAIRAALQSPALVGEDQCLAAFDDAYCRTINSNSGLSATREGVRAVLALLQDRIGIDASDPQTSLPCASSDSGTMELGRKIARVSAYYAYGYRGQTGDCFVAASNSGYFILKELGFTHEQIQAWHHEWQNEGASNREAQAPAAHGVDQKELKFSLPPSTDNAAMEAMREFNRLSLVIESAVRTADPTHHRQVIDLIFAVRAALSQSQPVTEKGGAR